MKKWDDDDEIEYPEDFDADFGDWLYELEKDRKMEMDLNIMTDYEKQVNKDE